MPMVATGDYTIRDLGDERVLTIKGAEYRTYYSERVVRMLIERKSLHRATLWRLADAPSAAVAGDPAQRGSPSTHS